jgi:predicted dehydrogenase
MNLAIIGAGPHGIRLIKAATKFVPANNIAVVDHSVDALKKVEEFNTFLDMDEMLHSFMPEVCIISTNGPSHYFLAEKAIQNGVKKLLLTKPLTCTLQDARNLIRLATEKGVKIAVDHGLRYDDTYNWIKSKIQEKKYGELLSVNIMRNGIGLGCLATHSFDLANFLFDAFPSRITAWVDQPYTKNPRGEQFVDPGGLVILDYGSDKRAIVSQIERASGPMIVQLHFEHARMSIDVKHGTLELIEKKMESNNIPVKPIVLDKSINPHEYQVTHDTVYLMEKIIDNLLSNDAMIADVLHGAMSVEILVAAYMSSENANMPVQLPLSDTKYINKFLPVT